MKTDSQLQRDVMDELVFEPSIDHSQIGVAAKNGVVTLTGFVKSYAEKVAAERALRRVKGVQGIAQDIEVRFASDPKTSDSEIAERILSLFKWDSLVPDTLSAKVEHGWVTLTGDVEWHYQKQAAEKAAGRIHGVKGVSNFITVQLKPSTVDIKDRITAAIRRARDLDSSSIRVEVDGNVVRLTGKVEGWNERKVAEHAAWAAPGVVHVEDNIVLS